MMQIEDIISNVQVYGLEESIKRSKYPMSTDTNACTTEPTKTIFTTPSPPTSVHASSKAAPSRSISTSVTCATTPRCSKASTSYAAESKLYKTPYQPSLFEQSAPQFDPAKTQEMEIGKDMDLTYDTKIYSPDLKTRLSQNYFNMIGRLDSEDRSRYDHFSSL